MFCEKCGNNLPPNAKFCNKCGYYISDIEVAGEHNQTEQNKKANKRNLKVVLIVLTVIFLPVIGIYIYDEMSKNPDSNSNTAVETSSENAETWKEFNSVEGNFKILFPTLPTHESENYDIEGVKNQPKMEMYMSEQGNEIVYFASYVKYSDEFDLSNAKITLETTMNGSLKNINNGNVVSSSFSKFLNYDAIDYLLYSPEDDVNFKGKNFIVGKTLYALLITYIPKSNSSIQADKFFNSFQLNSVPVAQTNQNTKKESGEIDPVTVADYNEGYKSGYVDGRSSKGYLGDNYAEPATEERKDAYFIGYLDGFLKGCREGNFDCSAVENAINSLDQEPSTDVNLIPPSLN